MAELNKYVGLDVHKEKISVAMADQGRGQPRYWGEIENRPEAVKRLLARLSFVDERLRWCYEAGPCGYECTGGLWRPVTTVPWWRQR